MSFDLPFRRPAHNSAAGPAAPGAVHLIATRARGADAAIVAVRADLSDLSRPGAIRHACQVFDAMAARFDGETVDVQLLDGAGVPLMFATGEPEARGATAGKPCARCGWHLRPDHGGICPVCSPEGDRR